MMEIVRIISLFCLIVILQGCHGRTPHQQRRQADACIEQSSLNACVAPLYRSFGRYIRHFTTTFAFTTDGLRRDFCPGKQATVECIGDAVRVSSCNEALQALLKANIAAGDFICSDRGYQLLQGMSSSQCGLRYDDFLYGEEICRNMAEPYWSELGPSELEEACSNALRTFINCLLETVGPDCGEPATVYTEELLRVFTEVYPLYDNCVGSSVSRRGLLK